MREGGEANAAASSSACGRREPGDEETRAEREIDRALEAFERAMLGRPASMGRREVSRGAGVSIRSARKFWHAMGFPVVQEGDAMFTEADLAALSRVAQMVRDDIAPEDFALSMTRAIARTMDRLAAWQLQLVNEEIARQRQDDPQSEAVPEGDPEAAAAWMTSLVDELEETASLAVLDGDMVIYTGQVASTQMMRTADEVGRRVGLHTSGVGKAVLAELDDARILKLVTQSGLPAPTGNSAATLSAVNPNSLNSTLAGALSP